MAHMIMPSNVEVWQPKGFRGLELHKVDVEGEAFVRKRIEANYFCVSLRGLASHYHGGYHETPTTARPTLLLFRAGEVLESTTSATWSFRNLAVDDALLDSVALEGGSQLAATLTAPAPAYNLILCEQLLRLFRTFKRASSALEREIHLMHTLRGLLRYCTRRPPPERPAGKEHRAVGLIRDFLHNYFSEDVTLRHLATLTGLNRTYLLEVFGQEVGLSPHQYLTGVRVHEAKRLIAAGESAAQVAVAVGFTDQSHLTRAFKRLAKVTPVKYQKARIKS